MIIKLQVKKSTLALKVNIMDNWRSELGELALVNLIRSRSANRGKLRVKITYALSKLDNAYVGLQSMDQGC